MSYPNKPRPKKPKKPKKMSLNKDFGDVSFRTNV